MNDNEKEFYAQILCGKINSMPWLLMPTNERGKKEEISFCSSHAIVAKRITNNVQHAYRAIPITGQLRFT